MHSKPVWRAKLGTAWTTSQGHSAATIAEATLQVRKVLMTGILGQSTVSVYSEGAGGGSRAAVQHRSEVVTDAGHQRACAVSCAGARSRAQSARTLLQERINVASGKRMDSSFIRRA